jgi:hypothetical protein
VPADFPTSESELRHIFRKAEGHVEDTPENRRLLFQVANDELARLESDQYGNIWAVRMLEDGQAGLGSGSGRDDCERRNQYCSKGVQSFDGTEEVMREPEAYRMMFEFLEARYRRLPSDALGALLGEMQLAADGEPFDPAIAEEWDRLLGDVRQDFGPRAVTEQRRAS